MSYKEFVESLRFISVTLVRLSTLFCRNVIIGFRLLILLSDFSMNYRYKHLNVSGLEPAEIHFIILNEQERSFFLDSVKSLRSSFSAYY